MSKPFNELITKMSPTAQQKIKGKSDAFLVQMPLQELRQARDLSQVRLAEILNTKQANVSRIERRADMYISTLRSYIRAMGGDLNIVAQFPEGDVQIDQFTSIEDSP